MKNYPNYRGIEREALRIQPDGNISIQPHPRKLGCKLTNPYITVDFSESLLEFITPPYETIDDSLLFLQKISEFAAKNLENGEILLSSSMPMKTDDAKINIADFGTSPSGLMKTLYRKGLANRYGKIMQIISGIHYNFSFNKKIFTDNFPDKHSDDLYFKTINYYFQYMWLIPYFFGASPICAKNSISNNLMSDYDAIDKDYCVSRFATSLRMSPIGYKSSTQDTLNISYDNIDQYTYDLLKATETPESIFNVINLSNQDNEKLQLNSNILQIENEYYSEIRPKQIASPCERPAEALRKRGVAYIEVRVLDVNPYEAIGISNETAYFIEALLYTCLMSQNNQFHSLNYKENFNKIVTQGRNKQLELSTNIGNMHTSELGNHLLDEIEYYAKKMGSRYLDAVKEQRKKLDNPNLTLSGKMFNDITNSGLCYSDWLLAISNKNHKLLTEKSIITSEEMDMFKKEAVISYQACQTLEASSKVSLDEYIQLYYSYNTNNLTR